MEYRVESRHQSRRDLAVVRFRSTAAEWMQANGREPAGTMWEEYRSGPSTPPAQTRTDIVWPVAPLRR